MPDLIYFDNTNISPSINYYVQELFSLNSGDRFLPVSLDVADGVINLAVSCVQDSNSRDLILKMVSRENQPILANVVLGSALNLEASAFCTVLTGDPLSKVTFGRPAEVFPMSSNLPIDQRFIYEIPANSLTIIRAKTS